MTTLSITATVTRKDGAPLEPHRVAHLLAAFAAAVERMGCEWTHEVTQEDEEG